MQPKVKVHFKPLIIGGILGALAATILGFTWGGWVTAGKANAMADERASEARVAILAPICASNFRQSPDAQAQLAKLEGTDSWSRSTFIENGGWAQTPGAKSISTAVSGACAKLLLKK